MKKGITLIEIIVIVAIVGILLGLVVVTVSGGSDCKQYGDRPVNEVPAKCLRYFNNQNVNVYRY